MDDKRMLFVDRRAIWPTRILIGLAILAATAILAGYIVGTVRANSEPHGCIKNCNNSKAQR